MRKTLVIFVFVLACVIVTLAMTAAMRSHLHARDAELQLQLAREGERIAEETNRRSKLLENVAAKQAAAMDPRLELLHLRGEISGLRRSAKNLAALPAAVEKLRAEIALATNSPPVEEAIDPSKVRAHWAKEQLAFAGHADEMSALQSSLWALSRGDKSSLMRAMEHDAALVLGPDSDYLQTRDSPESRSRMQRLAEALAPVTGFSVLSDNLLSKMPEMIADNQTPDNTAIYKVHFDREGSTRGIILKRERDEWKLASVVALGGTEVTPIYEMTLWP